MVAHESDESMCKPSNLKEVTLYSGCRVTGWAAKLKTNNCSHSATYGWMQCNKSTIKRRP